jgi:hypothetical protein
MNKILTYFLLILMAVTFTLTPKTALAQDDTMPLIFRDTLWGAGIGAFLGGLLLLTTDDKSDHWDYVAYGSLIGAVGGLAYSVTSTSHALVEVEKERVVVGLPTLHTANASRIGKKEYSVELFKFCY